MQQIIVDFGAFELFGFHVPLRLYSYGSMLVLGFLLGIGLACRRARRAGESPDAVIHCGVLALIGGVVGARAAYVVENWRAFAQSPNALADVVDITSGGLIYYGGVALAAVGILAYLRLKRLPARRYLDLIAASLMVGLAFGRAGCLLNGCCYGARCRTDWWLSMRFPMYSKPLVKLDGGSNPYSETTVGPSPVYYDQFQSGEITPDPRLMTGGKTLIPPRAFDAEQVRIAESSWSHPVKPAQALGLLNALVLAALLTAFYRLRRPEGQVFALLMVLYPMTRFILELIRADNSHSLRAGVLTHNQYTSLAVMAAGAILMLVLRKLPASAGPTGARRQECAKPRG